MSNTCPVCGFDGLKEPPYDDHGFPSYIICPCCGYEYGYDDNNLNLSFETYRHKWITAGANWFIPCEKPTNWNLQEQLNNLQHKRQS